MYLAKGEPLLAEKFLNEAAIQLKEYIMCLGEEERSEAKEWFLELCAHVNEIQKYIHSRFNEKIAIEDLCKEVNMSETLLTTCFKSTTGKTIIEYINCLRIDKAKQLLAETDMRITDISYELGFNDGAYFNRVFKKTVGTSPNEYRKQKQKPQ